MNVIKGNRSSKLRTTGKDQITVYDYVSRKIIGITMRFYSLEKLINLHDNYRKVIKIDQYNLMLVQVQGELHLVESQCPHRGHPLSESDIIGTGLRCPLHGYQFDIATGDLLKATEEPCRGLKIFDLVYQETEVGVML